MSIDIRIKHCKHTCHLVQGYVGLKRIKFGVEMGYRKCSICECHFFRPDYNVCKCCGTKLRLKMRDEIGNGSVSTIKT